MRRYISLISPTPKYAIALAIKMSCMYFINLKWFVVFI